MALNVTGVSPGVAAARSSADAKYVIVFQKSENLREQRSALKGEGVPVGKPVALINADVTEMNATQARKLDGAPGVKYVEKAQAVTALLTPNDTYYNASQWDLHGTYGINAPTAWDITTGGVSPIVAVSDTGVDYNHPDLAANIWANPGESGGGKETNGVDDDADGYVDDVRGINSISGAASPGDPMDDHGHGTHVSGTIGAVTNNSQGIAGINWNTQIMALKFLDASGSGWTSDAIVGINYAVAHGAKVINASWGGGGYSQALRDAIRAAGEAGVTFVAAAGNSGVNADVYPMYPAAYDENSIVSVASTTSTGALSSFSNYGVSSVDLGAPGSSIMSTLPNNSYASWSGTSMAAPHVTGVAALLLSAQQGLSVAQLKSMLLTNTRPLPSLNGKTVSGGLLDANLVLGGDPPPDSQPPFNTVLPVISGTATPGSTLTCSTGSWNNTPTGYAYQWKRNDAALNGKTSNTYVVVEADVGKQLTCAVTASNADGGTTTTSSPVVPSAAATPVNTSSPTVVGNAAPGEELICDQGTWTNSPTYYAYQWHLNGTPIGGEDEFVYTVRFTDVGSFLSCAVTASNTGGAGFGLSAAVLVVDDVGGAPLNAKRPFIAGEAKPGYRLTCRVGRWVNGVDTWAYEWRRDGQLIRASVKKRYMAKRRSGQPRRSNARKRYTKQRYTVKRRDVGHKLRCVVTASNDAGAGVAASNAVLVKKRRSR